jgi:uncharacterized RDD family membrane protein YckC
MSDTNDFPGAPDANRFAPPTAEVQDLPDAAGGPVLAGRWLRFGGAFVDGLIQGVIAIPLMFWMIGSYTAASMQQHKVQNILIGLAVFLVLQGWLLATQGQTLGKKVVGTRIIRTDGTRVGFGRMLGLRVVPIMLLPQIPVVGGIFALIGCVLIFRRSRRMLHDEIAGTIVATAESTAHVYDGAARPATA